jgi:hypothetical protein
MARLFTSALVLFITPRVASLALAVNMNDGWWKKRRIVKKRLLISFLYAGSPIYLRLVVCVVKKPW